MDGANTQNPRIVHRKRPARPAVAPQRNQFSPRLVRNDFDKSFFLIIVILLTFGIVMMFSASYVWSVYKNDGDGFYFVKRQILFAVVGIVLMMALSFVDYHILMNTKVVYTAFLVTYLLAAYTSAFGVGTAGARRWIEVGSLSFQPSEILKVAFIMLFAYLLAIHYPKFKKMQYSLQPFVVILGLCLLVLYFQRHLSAMIIFTVLGLSMMFVGGIPMKHFIRLILVLGVVGGIAAVVLIMHEGGMGYVAERFQSWRDPLSDIQDTTYQTYQSLLAIGSGGIFGLGFGQSRQKYLYLSESQNDFIFSIICEELGLIGAILVILLFTFFIFKGFTVATKAPDRFGMLLTAGITIQVGLQAFLNIMVATNAIPNTGISLPFFSYGGTALIIQLCEMGIILSVSRQVKNDS